MKHATYDVVISGGGLAGLTLARQLKMRLQNINILVLERNTFPVPEAAYKVGESTVEIAGFYYGHVLELDTYFTNEHFLKCGLRFFFKDGQTDYANYPEIGLSTFAKYCSYQLDRGKLENDLYTINKQNGIEIVDGASVLDILLHDGDEKHEIIYNLQDGRQFNVHSSWVIDASGRRSILQKKLGLRKQVDSQCSAIWFRVEGRLDVNDFVSQQNIAWHQRAPYKVRYYSTTHLMGTGYWIWLIPLASGYTSVGIVFDEHFHTYSQLNSFEKTMVWLRQSDHAILADKLADASVADFLALRHYSYSSRQVFSANRWACTGDAALFPDPFYSPGSNLIGYSNSIITQLISDYSENNYVDTSRIDFYNNFVISQNEWLIYHTHSSYAYFGNAQVASLGYLWDAIVGFSIATPQMFNGIFLSDEKTTSIQEIVHKFYSLSFKVRQLLVDWSKTAKGSFSFSFINYLNIPFVKELYNMGLTKDKPLMQLIKDYQFALERIEDFVQVVFRMIIEDCLPETVAYMPYPYWINAWAISLSPVRWEDDGLFNTTTMPRDISGMDHQLRSLFVYKKQVVSHTNNLKIELNL